MSNPHGFEFTPQGILPLGTYREGVEESAISGATAQVPGPVPVSPQAVHVTAHRAPVATVQPKPMSLSPRDVVRLARRRLREVKADIKRLGKLQKEREQLERLLLAADGKFPKAPGIVRDISHRAG